MLKNYITTAFRNLLRNRSYTLINVLGLSLGIGAALVLFKIVIFEKSFDEHHSNYDQIYRFVKEEINTNVTEKKPGVPNPFAEAFKNDYPEFGLLARTFYAGEAQVSIKGNNGQFKHLQLNDGVTFADDDVFDIFDFDLLIGDKTTPLSNPKTAVISESEAMKLFGLDKSRLENVIGKELKIDNELVVTITAVMADQPQNTMLPFTLMIEYDALDGFFDFFDKENWNSTSSNAHLYLLKPENVSAQQISEVLPAFEEKYMGESAATTNFDLQKYSDIHFQPEYGAYNDRVVAEDFLLIPLLVAVFLILTACVNFINLATAQAVKRSKEVGIRKVLGGQKQQLALQFMGETFFLTLVSVILALGMAELALNMMPEIIGYELSLDLVNDAQLLGLTGLVTLGVTLLAGTYPALILSSLKPAMALKGKGQSAMAGKVYLRRGLVVVQFWISQVLVICTLVVISQMDYFHNADLGFRRTSIINFDLPEPDAMKVNLLKSELSRNARISHVSFAFSSPRSTSNIGSSFNYAPLKSENDYDMAAKIIDENFVPLYDIQLLAGRNLTAGDTTFQNAIVSETVIDIMGISDPEEAIGESIETGFGGPKRIVGVFNDFHSNSLRESMTPLVMINAPDYYYQGSIRFEGDEEQTQDVLAALKQIWSTQFPDFIFDHQVYSESLREDYEEEANMLDLFKLFSGIAIVIGCLGLYGLISFMANQKTKEIGVRKVLGASVGQILKLFSHELLILITVSFLLSVPFGYYFMQGWLQDFEYSIDINIGVFVIAVGFTLVVSGITTGFRSLKAATANPVDSLRSE
ncbi:MAG: FtsX-like permease family protein [Roseivirga sp.]|nr:FtsX-like permease family protein [Roseivirga sp.]